MILAFCNPDGGTFDISILEMRMGVSGNRSAVDGDVYLGGEDFDVILVNHLLNEVKKEHGIDLSSDGMAIQRIRDAVKNAKVELSSAPQAEICLPFITADESGPKHINAKLSRNQSENGFTTVSVKYYYASKKNAGSAADAEDHVGTITQEVNKAELVSHDTEKAVNELRELAGRGQTGDPSVTAE